MTGLTSVVATGALLLVCGIVVAGVAATVRPTLIDPLGSRIAGAAGAGSTALTAAVVTRLTNRCPAVVVAIITRTSGVAKGAGVVSIARSAVGADSTAGEARVVTGDTLFSSPVIVVVLLAPAEGGCVAGLSEGTG